MLVARHVVLPCMKKRGGGEGRKRRERWGEGRQVRLGRSHRGGCHGRGSAAAAIFVNYKAKQITLGAAGAVTRLKGQLSMIGRTDSRTTVSVFRIICEVGVRTLFCRIFS